jgi:hypothetical protein
VASTTVVHTPIKYVRASEHTPVEVAVADLDVVRDTEGAREALILLDVVRESVRLPLSDLVTVRSVDSLADTLLDIDLDPVSEAVKLGDTGDFVKDGVGVGDGIITV